MLNSRAFRLENLAESSGMGRAIDQLGHVTGLHIFIDLSVQGFPIESSDGKDGISNSGTLLTEPILVPSSA